MTEYLLRVSNFSIEYWGGFFAYVLFISLVDIYVILGPTKNITFRRSVFSTIFWFANAVIVTLMFLLVPETDSKSHYSADFFIAYLIELSLSIDNVFVFIMIFDKLKIVGEMKRSILHIGIISAIIMRLIMILFGLHFVNKFQWLFYIFGSILIFGAIKMLIPKRQENRIARNRFFSTAKKDRFFIKGKKGIIPTVNLLALILIEKADIVFAIDSIPAVMSVTRDAFIIFTSNVLAIAGLRSLFFLISHTAEKFTYLKYGIVLILLFIGIKLLLIPQEIIVPKELSLAVVSMGIIIPIMLSTRARRFQR